MNGVDCHGCVLSINMIAACNLMGAASVSMNGCYEFSGFVEWFGWAISNTLVLPT